ncbi:MAG: CPBP family intramembrane glutamic endopeptidase [Cyanobacteria bacterium P01_H01_bin.105]
MIQWMHLYRRLAHGPLIRRIIVFFVALLLLWAPFALVFYGVGYWTETAQLASALALVALYGCFVGHAWYWGRWGHAWAKPFRFYGLVFCRRFAGDVVCALGCGFGLVCFLFGTEVLMGWATVYPKPLATIALEGLVVGLGISFAEELLFRGWLLSELQTGMPRFRAIVWSSMIFAIAHFIKPLSEILRTSPQFFGLLLLGLILGCWRYVHRLKPFSSLGLPIGLHAGLIWGYYIVDVADLIVPSGRVSEWVTGIHGNPLSGALGVFILGILAIVSCLNLNLSSYSK